MGETDEQKRRAGHAAAELVESGMRVGFGTGSTADWFTSRVGERVRSGALTRVSGVPTSRSTAELLLDNGIPVVDLDGPLELAVDGADEIEPHLSLIKGGGGALLREKIVAAAADRFVVVAHAAKMVPALGTGFALPVEVARFGVALIRRHLDRYGQATLRGGDRPFITDNGNYIVDIATGPISDPDRLDAVLSAIPGVVGTGLFVGMADTAVVGTADGTDIHHA